MSGDCTGCMTASAKCASTTALISASRCWRGCSIAVAAARPMPANADGASRARSASEAFLYRRLETLNATRGRFQLNVNLSIPFDSRSRMEVDLLCDDARVAVELDGAQHLTDPAAYRRDRRKDQLLQENGYIVLRFLPEDLAKDLDTVLDAILRSLAHRRGVNGVMRPIDLQPVSDGEQSVNNLLPNT